MDDCTVRPSVSASPEDYTLRIPSKVLVDTWLLCFLALATFYLFARGIVVSFRSFRITRKAP